MAIAFDAVSTGSTSSSATVSFSKTCTGSDLILIAGVTFYKNTNSAISGVTYNSVSMTLVPSSAVNHGGTHYTAMYYLVNPATGSNTFTVTFSGNAPFEAAAGASSFTGVDQTTPLGTAATATGTSTTPSVSVSAATDDLVIDALLIEHAGTLSVGAGQTSRYNAIGNSGFTKYAGSTEPGAASVTMSWSDTTGGKWAIAAVPLKPKATAGGGGVPRFKFAYAQRRRR